MLILERRRVKLSKPNIIILGALILVFLISILNITSTHLGAAFAPIHEEEVTISFEPEIEKVVTVKKISKNDVNDSNNMSTAQNKNKETTNEINAANTKPGKQEQRTPPNASILAVKKTALENQEQSTPDHSKSAEEPAHRFAYAYLMAGCDANCCHPKNPGYLGYIYNIIVSKRILLERGSNIDVVVLVRMHTDTNETRLPPEHESMLVKSGVIIKYLPKPVIDNFHTAMMDKFSILNLIEYERVMFLDSDVMPIWNMDYMFELTTGDKPVLEENVILAYKGEPANGGCFILKPDRKDYCDMLELIDKHENLGYDFNKTIGWGHVITPPDAWVPYKGKNGTLWDWHGAFTDQVSTKVCRYISKIVAFVDLTLYVSFCNSRAYFITGQNTTRKKCPSSSEIKFKGGMPTKMVNLIWYQYSCLVE
jgi:hypothetical protein